MEMLTEIGSRTFNQGVSNFEHEANNFDHDASNFEHEASNFDHDSSSLDSHLSTLDCEGNNLVVEATNLDEGDANDLVTAVKNLARELENDASPDCDINSFPSSAESSVACESSSSLTLVHKSDSKLVDDNVGFHKETFKDLESDDTNEFASSYTQSNVKTQLLHDQGDGNVKPVVISYSNCFENSSGNQDSKESLESENGCILNIDSPALQTPSFSSEKPMIKFDNKDIEPLKIYLRSQGNGQFHSDQIAANIASYILTSEGSELRSIRDDESCRPEMVATRVLPASELAYGSSIDSIDNVKEETVIYVVENDSSENVSMDLVDSSSKSSLTAEEKAASGMFTSSVIPLDVPCNSQSQSTESANLMLSLSLPLVDVNVTVMDGSIMVRCSNDASIQVPAKLLYLPEPENLEATEEICAMLAPQLLEGGVLFPGNNILIFKNQSFLISVNLLLWKGEKQHTQISISSPVESMEAYQGKGTNFVMITSSSEHGIVMGSSSSQCLSDGVTFSDKFPVQNAPNSSEPGLFQCDKCDKTYKVRSSLNSHKVTHNAEKMYKCDECDKAFHYSTPLQIHKRTHSDERPYQCLSCSASFRSKANLKYHERLHTGERPIACHECGQGFKDYTSLKRHRTKAHDLVMMKCDECGQICNSIDNLTTHLWQVHNILYVDKVLHKCEKCGETFNFQKSYNSHMATHKRGEKNSQGGFGKLTDYTYRCGICNMTCHSKSQMVFHIQVHAALKRYNCRYCKNAYMYYFLLAKHVREEHPNDPQWFCQHCDLVFRTCREVNTHSCRSVRGNYSCPQSNCDFKTEIRHRLFRHIVKKHPEDKTPYYCDFCKNSFEDPNKLRYHQKREHPEEMQTLTMQRETSRNAALSGEKMDASSGEKTDASPLDMSQIEMTIEDNNTIIYHIPQHLRNDEVFKEKVKFKCYYCEAKFPVKNAMTRHILKEHPSEKAYKCLSCNIFFKTTVDSKNHNRKYHRFRETGGRDPLRNEKAMKKKAQWCKEQLEKSDPEMKNVYKFRCRFCPMVYRFKRPLIFHYKKWHADEKWDYLPDKLFQNRSAMVKKKRKLVFFHCSYDDKCQVVFDDRSMLIEHLFNAHGVEMDDADKYIRTRTVLDNVHQGRIPRNAVNVCDNEVRGKRSYRDLENEEDVDDPISSVEELDTQKRVGKLKMEEDMELGDCSQKESEEMVLLDRKKSFVSNQSKKLSKAHLKLEKISSIKDVKKMLYRCGKCCLCFPNKSEYREHSIKYRGINCCDFLHLHLKQESEEEMSDTDEYEDGNFQMSLEEEEDMDDESSMPRVKKRNGRTEWKRNNRTDYSELGSNNKIEQKITNENEVEHITVSVVEDELSENPKILYVNEIETNFSCVTDNLSGPILENAMSDVKNKDVLNKDIAEKVKLVTECLPLNVEEDGRENKESVERTNKGNISQVCVEHVRSTSKNKIKEVDLEEGGIDCNLRNKSERSGNKYKRPVLHSKQCDKCSVTFKTRSELSFHIRQDH